MDFEFKSKIVTYMNLEIEFYECKKKLNPPSVLRIYSKNYLAKILLRVYIFLFSLMCKDF